MQKLLSNTKETKSNEKKKTSQNKYLPVLFGTQEQKLEKSARSFQVRVHFLPAEVIRKQTHLLY